MKGKIHFMGIGGSGASACAIIAKAYGYDVEGSNIDLDTPYIKQVRQAGITIYKGHKNRFLENVRLLVISPAVKFTKDNKFIDFAKSRKIEIITWQEFSGKYLQKNKLVICVSGTHGKSTSTAMLGLIFEKAGLDPTVLVGAKVKEWNSNYRLGNGDIFITESDEFYDNFLNYRPNAVLLNNIEFDHPDYFKSLNDVYKSFIKHIFTIKDKGLLVANVDSSNVKKLVDNIKRNDLHVISISIQNKKSTRSNICINSRWVDMQKRNFIFEDITYNQKYNFQLKMYGNHNLSNVTGVIALAMAMDVDVETIRGVIGKFNGVGRRSEYIGKFSGVRLYDDYAHHPTAIKVTLEALRQKHPGIKLIAVIEPHSFSRTKALLKSYKDVFSDVDTVILAPIFKARDTDDFGVNLDMLAKASNHNNIYIASNQEDASSKAVEVTNKGDVIIVMGAGDSYKITQQIRNKL